MNEGDRMCPACETESLVEKGLTQWKCLNIACEEVFLTEDLDRDIEIDDNDEWE